MTHTIYKYIYIYTGHGVFYQFALDKPLGLQFLAYLYCNYMSNKKTNYWQGE